jgi:hypothetical protein
MDSSLSLFFTTEEIVRRLSKKECTGGLHIFTANNAANLFFRGGVIVAANKGLMEGEELLKQVLEWKEPRFVWQNGMEPGPNLKAFEIDFDTFLARLKMAPKLEIAGKTLSTEPPKGATDKIPPIHISIPTRAASTGRVALEVPDTALEPELAATGPVAIAKTSFTIPPPAEPELAATGPMTAARPTFAVPSEPRPPLEVTREEPAPSLTATKNMNAAPKVRLSYEESLLRKHQLALVAVDADGPRRMRLVRLTNLVGRNPACDFTVDHASVSRQHCVLEITDRGLHVKDLSTTNGTKVNGIPMDEGYINLGDKLTIGHLTFLVEKDEQEEAIAA